MKRYLLATPLAALMLVAAALPAFAQGPPDDQGPPEANEPTGNKPEGAGPPEDAPFGSELAGPGGNQSGREGNPGKGLVTATQNFPDEQAGTPFDPCPRPLPLGGTDPGPGFNNAPGGVVFTAPGTPFEGLAEAEPCPE
jgi:hypothetical protein